MNESTKDNANVVLRNGIYVCVGVRSGTAGDEKDDRNSKDYANYQNRQEYFKEIFFEEDHAQ